MGSDGQYISCRLGSKEITPCLLVHTVYIATRQAGRTVACPFSIGKTGIRRYRLTPVPFQEGHTVYGCIIWDYIAEIQPYYYYLFFKLYRAHVWRIT